MPDHVAVGVIANHEVILVTENFSYQAMSELIGTHLWLQIIGRYQGRLDEDSPLAIKWLLPAAVEEKGDMSILLCFGDPQLSLPEPCQELTKAVADRFRGKAQGPSKSSEYWVNVSKRFLAMT